MSNEVYLIPENSLFNVATNQTHVGKRLEYIRPTEDIFNSNDPKVKEDIIRMVVQYLNDEGYHVSKMTVMDEANVKWQEREEQQMEVKRMKKAILGKIDIFHAAIDIFTRS